MDRVFFVIALLAWHSVLFAEKVPVPGGIYCPSVEDAQAFIEEAGPCAFIPQPINVEPGEVKPLVHMCNTYLAVEVLNSSFNGDENAHLWLVLPPEDYVKCTAL